MDLFLRMTGSWTESTNKLGFYSEGGMVHGLKVQNKSKLIMFTLLDTV